MTTRQESSAGPWPVFHGDNRRTGQGLGKSARGKRRWKSRIGGIIESSPVLGANGLLYIGGGHGAEGWPFFKRAHNELVALRRDTGKKVWVTPTEGYIMNAPAIGAHGLVYIGTRGGQFLALDAETGEKRWEILAPEWQSSPLVGPDGAVYAIGYDSAVHVLDGATGTQRWQHRLARYDTNNHFSPVLGPDGILYVGKTVGGTLSALDPGTRIARWSFRTKGVLTDASLGDDGKLFCGDRAGFLYGLDSRSGKVLWRCPTKKRWTRPGPSCCPAIGADGRVYFGDDTGILYALDGRDGRVVWTFETREMFISSPALSSDGTVYIGGYDNRFYAVDCDTGEPRWVCATRDSIVSSPAIDENGVVYFASCDGCVYAYE